jgi:hypothetical protein
MQVSPSVVSSPVERTRLSPRVGGELSRRRSEEQEWGHRPVSRERDTRKRRPRRPAPSGPRSSQEHTHTAGHAAPGIRGAAAAPMSNPYGQNQRNGRHSMTRLSPKLFTTTRIPLDFRVVETGVTWATDYRYLNDSSEIRYTFHLARHVINERLRHNDLGSLGRAFVERVASGTATYADTRYYLCCFSEVDNSLSEWRAYGGRQGVQPCSSRRHHPSSERRKGRCSSGSNPGNHAAEGHIRR